MSPSVEKPSVSRLRSDPQKLSRRRVIPVFEHNHIVIHALRIFPCFHVDPARCGVHPFAHGHLPSNNRFRSIDFLVQVVGLQLSFAHCSRRWLVVAASGCCSWFSLGCVNDPIARWSRFSGHGLKARCGLRTKKLEESINPVPELVIGDGNQDQRRELVCERRPNAAPDGSGGSRCRTVELA